MRELQHTQLSDAYELLSTRLALPRPHLSLVSRGPLLAQLDEGLQHKLTLLNRQGGLTFVMQIRYGEIQRHAMF